MGLQRKATGRTVTKMARVQAPGPPAEKHGRPRVLGESHLGLRVTDLDRSARLNVEVVGFREHVRVRDEVILSCGPWVFTLYSSVRRDSHVRVCDLFEVGRAGLHHLAFALGSAEEVDDAAVWLDQHNVRRKQVRPGFTPGSRFVTFYDPDGIPCEYYYMDAAYTDLYGMEASAG